MHVKKLDIKREVWFTLHIICGESMADGNVVDVDLDKFIEANMLPTKEESPSIFGDKIVVFLDILGTTDKIGMDEISEEKLQKIVEKVIGLRDYIQSVIRHLSTVKICSIAISDCFILVAEKKDLQNILLLASKAMHYGLTVDEPILIRGGISYGQVSMVADGENIKQIMGPAYNIAYELESKISEYPRIVINPDLIAELDEQYYYRGTDGLYSVNFLKILSKEMVISDIDSFINETKEKLSLMGSHDSDRFKIRDCRKEKKRNWLINYLEVVRDE